MVAFTWHGGAAALILRLLTKWYVPRISRRIFNVAAGRGDHAARWWGFVWGIVALVSAQNALQTAQQKGSDSVEALSAATVLLSRAQGDLSLVLVNRGSDTRPLDFTVVVARARPGGLIAEGSRRGPANRDDYSRERFRDEYAAYRGQRGPSASPRSRTAATADDRDRARYRRHRTRPRR